MYSFFESINRFVWGIPALVLIVSVGFYLSIRTGFIQLRCLPHALRSFFRQLKPGENRSSFQSLCTALAATVGTGNLAGVAGAIAIGGPGSIFWMWICGMLGMVIKFAEATLAVRYGRQNAKGETVGGPMYMITDAMPEKWKFLAYIYCFLGVFAAFGVGNATQINALIGGVNSALQVFGRSMQERTNVLLGIAIAGLVTVIFLGGAQRIGKLSQLLVPFAALLYLALGCGVLLMRWDRLPGAFGAIFQGAFSPRAVTGGTIGSAYLALRVGASRGVFTNEAGMGTAAIAHAGAKVAHPTQQGMMGVVEVFLDTIVICTMTALVIFSSDIPISYGIDTGIVLTMDAFSDVYGNWVRVPIAASICCFAIATILGWGFYGARCAQFLFGDQAWRYFVALQAGAVILGAVLKTGMVWLLAETVNGLMVIPNLIVLLYLAPELVVLVRQMKQFY